jgi:hypothetical protein
MGIDRWCCCLLHSTYKPSRLIGKDESGLGSAAGRALKSYIAKRAPRARSSGSDFRRDHSLAAHYATHRANCLIRNAIQIRIGRRTASPKSEATLSFDNPSCASHLRRQWRLFCGGRSARRRWVLRYPYPQQIGVPHPALISNRSSLTFRCSTGRSVKIVVPVELEQIKGVEEDVFIVSSWRLVLIRNRREFLGYPGVAKITSARPPIIPGLRRLAAAFPDLRHLRATSIRGRDPVRAAKADH